MPVDTDLWSRACARLVAHAGRARVHQLRNALNAVAIGVELLARDRDHGGSLANQQTGQRADAVRHGIDIAGAQADGLQTLIADTFAPGPGSLPDAVRWALEVAEPVARRKAVTLRASRQPDDLPEVDVPAGANVALGLLLTEACLASTRGSRCAVRFDVEAPAMIVEWQGSGGPDAGISLARALLADVLGPEACSFQDAGDHREIAVVLPGGGG